MNDLGHISDLAALADQQMERASILLSLLTEDGNRRMFTEREQSDIDFWLSDLVVQARAHMNDLHSQIRQQAEARHE